MFLVVYRQAQSNPGDETPPGPGPGHETPAVLSPPCPEDAEDQATHSAEVVSSSAVLPPLPAERLRQRDAAVGPAALRRPVRRAGDGADREGHRRPRSHRCAQQVERGMWSIAVISVFIKENVCDFINTQD